VKPILKERRISRRILYTGRILDLWVDKVRLGRLQSTREVVNHRPAVAMVPILPGPKIVLIRQYRYAVKELLWEIPAGILDRGESPRRGAARELREETGYRAGCMTPLTSIWTSPGFCLERIDLFLAEDLHWEGSPSPDEDECLRSKIIAFSQAMDWARRGLIHDAKTLLGLHLAAAKLGGR
jgi:ADP-ribose pyrophosphatase